MRPPRTRGTTGRMPSARATVADGGRGLTLGSPILDIDADAREAPIGIAHEGRPGPRGARGEHVRDPRRWATSLHHYPRRYIDRSRVETISGVTIGAYVTVIAHVHKVQKRLTRKRQSMVTVTVARRHRLPRPHVLQPAVDRDALPRGGRGGGLRGGRRCTRGSSSSRNRRSSSFEATSPISCTPAASRPVHPATEGITTRTIRELLHRAFERLAPIDDPLPRRDRRGRGARVLRPGAAGHPLPGRRRGARRGPTSG